MSIKWSALPDPRASLASAMRKAGHSEIQSIFIEWPHLREACVRLAELTAGEIMPDEKEGALLVTCLRAGTVSFFYAASGGKPGTARAAHEFIRAISEKAAAGLLSRTVWLHLDGILRKWEPMEMGLLEAIETFRARSIELTDEKHCMLGTRDGMVIIASRIFHLNDLVRAGIIDATTG